MARARSSHRPSALVERRLGARGLGVLGAVAAHGLVFAAMRVLPGEPRLLAHPPRPAAALFDVDLSPLPLPMAAPAPQPPSPEPVRAPKPRAPQPPLPARAVAKDSPPPTPAAPAAAAAAAAAAVTTRDESASPSADTVASGVASAYAGGASAGAGTAREAARSEGARADGVVGGTGTAPADHSRAAALLGGLSWNDCPPPPEAEDEGVEHASVQLRLSLSADGHVEGGEVVSDPGYGFAREALRCARRKRFSPALDRAGRPVATQQIVVVRY